MPDNPAITAKLIVARAYVGNLESDSWNAGYTDTRVLNTLTLLIEAIEVLQAEVRTWDEESGRLTRLHQDHAMNPWEEHR